MEQQAGPVNWAPYNPIPAPGMVRLWILEAIAHGAEVNAGFPLEAGTLLLRNRCIPGLLHPDSTPGRSFTKYKK